MRDRLSAFLHTTSWAQVLGGTQDDTGIVWTRRWLPKKLGSYLLATRVSCQREWKLPETSSKDWFIRIQADSLESDQHLLAATSSYTVVETQSVQPRETVYLDLTQTEETLLAAMKPKHRYNIKVAQRHEVGIEIVSENTEQSLSRFLALLSKTAERHAITTHNAAHYRAILTNHPTSVWLCFATKDGEDCAATMVILHEYNATYLHGGSNYSKREYMAPYLLHWETIRALRKQGITTYDLWGVHTHNGVALENHPSAGTTRFKLGFGGIHVQYPPTRDIILKPRRYRTYSLLRSLLTRKTAFS